MSRVRTSLFLIHLARRGCGRRSATVRAALIGSLALAALTIGASPAAAQGPQLSVSATHDPGVFLRATAPNTTVYGGTLRLTVTNSGNAPTDGSQVTARNVLSSGLSALVNNPGFGAGITSASGPGWSCSGAATSTCTRSDVLEPGDSYPPVRITVQVASSAPAVVTPNAQAFGGGDPTGSSIATPIPVQADACPNGWSEDAEVTFSPPFRPGLHGGIRSGVTNPQRPNGCSLLDAIWEPEPFSGHGSFVGHVDQVTDEFVAEGLLTLAEKGAIQSAAARSDVGKKSDNTIDNSCDRRIGIKLDDGPSVYRPQTLAIFRDRQVHATVFENGVRIDDNPALAGFQVDEGHVVLNHTYWHPNLNNLFAADPALVVAELVDAEAAMERAGTEFTLRGVRPPFGSANTGVRELLTGLGYTGYFTSQIGTPDWEPDRSGQQIADAIVSQLRPGVIYTLHDGAIDTPAGAGTVAAMGMIIDRARALGYCYGVLDDKGNVVADRHVSSERPIPQVTNPVSYLPLVIPGTPPDPWKPIPQPLSIEATHSPEPFVRGSTGALMLTVSNVSDDPTDTSTVTVTNQIPSGLTATAASGPGWSCSGGGTRTCTRSGQPLAPGASYPPITISVNVGASAPATITNVARVTGHGGGVWVDQTSDTISVAPQP